ncbi:MAG: cyclophilin-like fold protein [Nitrososphaeraceae archaeon]
MSSENKIRSVSRIAIKVIINSKEILHGQLIRHLAPLTISGMLGLMPFHGAVHYSGDIFCYIPTHLNIGQEKSRKKFSRGDITLMTSNGAICFFLKDASVGYSMNYIGKVTSNIEKLVSLRSNDELTIASDID